MTAITRSLRPRPVIVLAGVLAAFSVSVALGAIIGDRSTFGVAALAAATGLATLAIADRTTDRLLDGGADAIRVAGASGVLLAGPAALLAIPVGAGVPIDRVAGADRVATSIAVSREAFDRSTSVVVVGPTAGADAVVGARLAADLGGPLLLAGDGVAEEIDRLGARRVLTVGGGVEFGDTDAVTYPVARADRYATSAAVAARIRPYRVYVTSSWRSALPVPVVSGDAVLLSPDDRVLPSAIRVLQRAQPAVVVVLDAEPNVVTFLRALLPEADVRRGGAAAPDATGPGAEWPWVAPEGSWPDVVTAGAAAASDGRPLVLVPARGGSSVDEGVRWLRDNRGDISEVTVVGGLVRDALLEDLVG